jgi:ABC-type transport system substrate-binding protein
MPNPVFLTRKSVLSASVFSLIALSSGVMLSGCPGRNAGGGKVPGVLRYALTAEPTTLDPALVTDGPTIDLLHNIYEGLVGWNDNNEVVPLGAEKWDVSPDGKTYTFTLRSGVKFQNGRPIVAGDYAYAISRSLDPKLAMLCSERRWPDQRRMLELRDQPPADATAKSWSRAGHASDCVRAQSRIGNSQRHVAYVTTSCLPNCCL